MSDDTWNGIYFCLLCKTKELSQESIHHHYLYFHNVQTLTSEEILPDNLDEVSCLSSKPHSVTQQGLDEAVNLHSKDMGAPEHIILSCDRDASTSTSSESKISPFVCTGKERATEGREHCLKGNPSDPAQSVNQTLPVLESCKYNGMENISNIGNVLIRSDESCVEGSDKDETQKSALYSHFPASFKPPESCLPKRNPVLSSTALTQIKRFASTAVASSTARDGHRKVIIICAQGMNDNLQGRDAISMQHNLQETACTQNETQEMIHSEVNNFTGEKGDGVSLEERRFSSILDSSVDVTKYEKDFLFQVGMKESSGKNIRYLREVYICLYCEAFEKYCLDRLIVHMMDSHQSEIMDRCSSEKMKSVRIKTISGVTEPGITSFQEYRSKLLEQKIKDKERRSRRVREKTLTTGGAVIGLPCLYCSKQFATHSKLQAHTDKHLNVKRFLCEECGRSFRSWHLLWSHKKDHLNASYGKIKCSLCSFQSGDTQALNKHYRIHPKQSHLCHICGNMYSSLRKHVKVHSLDRPYPCPFKGCTFRFTSEVPCKIHYQAHTTQGQRFACSKCNNRFPRKHHLLRHQVKVHGDSIEAQENNCNAFAESLSNSLVETFHVNQVEEAAAKAVIEEFHVVDQHHLDMVEELHP